MDVPLAFVTKTGYEPGVTCCKNNAQTLPETIVSHGDRYDGIVK